MYRAAAFFCTAQNTERVRRGARRRENTTPTAPKHHHIEFHFVCSKPHFACRWVLTLHYPCTIHSYANNTQPFRSKQSAAVEIDGQLRKLLVHTRRDAHASTHSHRTNIPQPHLTAEHGPCPPSPMQACHVYAGSTWYPENNCRPEHLVATQHGPDALAGARQQCTAAMLLFLLRFRPASNHMRGGHSY